MDSLTLSIVICAGLGLIFTAIVMAVRDLTSKNRISFEDDEQAKKLISQLPEISSEKPNEGMFGKMDHWFGRLAVESGPGLTADAAFLCAVFGGLLVGGVAFLWREDPILGTIGLVIGFMVVLAYLSHRRAKRMQLLREQLPQAMDLIARAVRAGESLDQAITLTAEYTQQPLAIEIRRCARQIDMGLSIDASVKSLCRRVPLTEMRIFAATLAVQRRAGGNLSTTLQRLAAVIRDRLSYQRQFRAQTASGRVSATLIMCAGPLAVLALFLWQPDYLEAFVTTSQGKAILIAAIVLQVIGLAIVMRVLKTDY